MQSLSCFAKFALSEIEGEFIVADDMPSLNGLDDDVMPLEERFRDAFDKD